MSKLSKFFKIFSFGLAILTFLSLIFGESLVGLASKKTEIANVAKITYEDDKGKTKQVLSNESQTIIVNTPTSTDKDKRSPGPQISPSPHPLPSQAIAHRSSPVSKGRPVKKIKIKRKVPNLLLFVRRLGSQNYQIRFKLSAYESVQVKLHIYQKVWQIDPVKKWWARRIYVEKEIKTVDFGSLSNGYYQYFWDGYSSDGSFNKGNYLIKFEISDGENTYWTKDRLIFVR